MLFEGRVMMVTGGGGGIGRATSLMAAKEGATIVSADINADNAGRVAAEVEALGREALAMETDTTDKAQVDRVVAAANDRFGKIDILINAAGLANSTPFFEQTGELFDQDRRLSPEEHDVRVAGGAAQDDRAALRAHRQHHFQSRLARAAGHGGLRGREGGDDGHGPSDGCRVR